MLDFVHLEEADLRQMAHHTLVSRSYGLVLFTIPKVGCTELIKLMRRLEGAPDWRDDPHYKPDRPFLEALGLERAREILNDPAWTRAVALRDPAERLLSAYLDKFVHTASYAADVFRPAGRGMPFDEFLGHVLDPNVDPRRPQGLHAGTDPHWRPQRLVVPVEKAAARLDLVGDFAAIREWIERVLRRVGAWEQHGASGWGRGGRSAIFATNAAPNRTGAARRMTEFYNPRSLRAVYEAYTADIAFAARAGIDLCKHAALLDRG